MHPLRIESGTSDSTVQCSTDRAKGLTHQPELVGRPVSNTTTLSPSRERGVPTLPKCQRLWGEVLGAITFTRQKLPGSQRGRQMKQRQIMPPLRIKPGTSDSTVQCSTDRAKRLTHQPELVGRPVSNTTTLQPLRYHKLYNSRKVGQTNVNDKILPT
jgi:hypothetical protein